MLIVPKLVEVPWSQRDFARANCAGAGCADRDECRRYRVRIEGPRDEPWERQSGQWISADVERLRYPDAECPHFRKYIPERKAA